MTEPERHLNLSAVVDPDLDAGHRLADRMQHDLTFGLRCRQRRGFGLSVELAKIDAERAKEQECILAHRLAPGVGAVGARHAEKVLERTETQKFRRRSRAIRSARPGALPASRARSRSIARGMK